MHLTGNKPLNSAAKPFPPCTIGLYPIVDHSHWLEKLLPLGVKTIQLRIKDPALCLETEIKKSIALAKQYNATLFINDYWELALALGAEGIHLGQEDLETADIDAIYRAHAYLGISTNNPLEVARAQAIRPSYIACGPIFPTNSKVVSSPPQGLTQLQHWQRTLPYPLVAIGGITAQNIDDVLATGVKGIAVISAITQAADPVAATRELLNKIDINGVSVD
ncbi:MAG: thiamine phosphate synthase [Legionellaceae bacterium]|nr:thiamine phosphate synthase [Legionellaceae bacterium]